MMLFMIVVSLAALVSCEPPIQGYNYQSATSNHYNMPSNAYLPPSTGYGTPSNNYVPPTSGHGVHSNHGTHGSHTGHDSHSQGHGHGSDHHVPKSYEFGYSVKDAHSGNDYNRQEVSDGNVVRGEYRVQLPDGRTQIVTYHADWQTGFHADVRYEGEARYPETLHSKQQDGYHYNAPNYSGSLTGFHGASNQPSTAYGPPGYH